MEMDKVSREEFEHNLARAAQEGIVFAFKYGMDIMNGMGIDIDVIRAGHANLFLSPLFREALAGVTGGSLYFLTENTALEVTLTTNVAFIVCSTPLLTMLLARLFYRSERATWRLVCGSLLALLGVGLVIFNGNFVLKLSPLGDVLSLTAALCWAFYSLIMRQVADRYSTVFITRKVFFYGVLTILPAFLVRPWQFPLEAFARPAVWMNLLFLSVLASLMCFVVWNFILKQLGTVRASNYIYLNPIFTSIGALLFLGEPLTPVALLGAACVLCGVYLAGKK